MPAADIEQRRGEAWRRGGEVAAVDEVAVEGEADDGWVARRGAACVVGRAVEALVGPVREGVAVPVRLAAALPHVRLARVDLAPDA